MTGDRAASTGGAGGGGFVAAATRNLGWLLASRGVLAVLSFFYLGFAAHTLGLKGFGRFALVTGASQALATFVAFQTWQIIVQYGVEPLHAGDTPRLARLLRACGKLDLVSALVGCVLSVAILQFGSEQLGISERLMPFAIGFAIIQLICIRSTALGILRLRDRFSLSALADSVTPVVRFFGALAAMLFEPTLRGFMTAWAAAELLTAAAYWILIVRTGDARLLLDGCAPLSTVLKENPGIMRFALSVNASSTLTMSTKQIPVLLVGATSGVSAAGAFRLALQLAQGLTKLSQLISRAVFPEFVRVARTLSPAVLRRVTIRSFMGGSVAAAVIMIVVVLIGKPVLGIMGGPGFVQGYPVLVWLAAAGCMDLATVGAESVLTALHRAVSVFVIRAIGVVTFLALTFLLLPRFGSTAIAMGVFAGSVIGAVLVAYAALMLGSSPAAKSSGDVEA